MGDLARQQSLLVKSELSRMAVHVAAFYLHSPIFSIRGFVASRETISRY
jgi:hypothetical protein